MQSMIIIFIIALSLTLWLHIIFLIYLFSSSSITKYFYGYITIWKLVLIFFFSLFLFLEIIINWNLECEFNVWVWVSEWVNSNTKLNLCIKIIRGVVYIYFCKVVEYKNYACKLPLFSFLSLSLFFTLLKTYKYKKHAFSSKLIKWKEKKRNTCYYN